MRNHNGQRGRFDCEKERPTGFMPTK